MDKLEYMILQGAVVNPRVEDTMACKGMLLEVSKGMEEEVVLLVWVKGTAVMHMVEKYEEVLSRDQDTHKLIKKIQTWISWIQMIILNSIKMETQGRTRTWPYGSMKGSCQGCRKEGEKILSL